MVARITMLQLKPGVMDDLIRSLQDAIALIVADLRGFNGMTLLVNDKESQALAVSLWATAADLHSAERNNAYHEQLAQLSNLLAAPPVGTIYDVSVQIDVSPEGTARIHGI